MPIIKIVRISHRQSVIFVPLILLLTACFVLGGCNIGEGGKEDLLEKSIVDTMLKTQMDNSYLIDGVSKKQKEIVRFYITEANSEGHNRTEWAIKSKLATVFYTVDNDLYMANVGFENKNQSWGKVYIVDTCLNHTSFSKIETLYFSWHFYNSYDNVNGVCKSKFTQKVTPLGTFFKLTMVLPESDSIIYKGYRANSIDTLRLYNIFNIDNN